MTILEIEYYKGDTTLYGKSIQRSELNKQLNEIENAYDREQDNFTELLCTRFEWCVFETEERPDYVYDRDVGRLSGFSKNT